MRPIAVRHCLRLTAVLAAFVLGSAARAQDLIGKLGEHVTVASDTLADIAVAHDLGYTELVAANPGVDPWLPGEGVRLVLPSAHLLPAAARRGIVINLAELRLYRFGKGKLPESYPIGIGTDGVQMPLGTSRIVRKRREPTWIPPASVLAEDPELPGQQRLAPEETFLFDAGARLEGAEASTASGAACT